MRLSKSITLAGILRDSIQEEESENYIDSLGFFNTVWNLVSFSVPVIIINLSGSLIEAINLIFIGHLLSPDYICAIGIAYCWSNITTYSLLLGLISTIENYCSEAFDNNDPYQAKIHFNRSKLALFGLTIILLLIFIWFSAFWLNLIFGLSPFILESAQLFLRYQSIGFIFMIQSDVCKQYANSLGIQKNIAFISLLTICGHYAICYFCVSVAGYDFYGTAIATSITYFGNYLLISIAISCNDLNEQYIDKETWNFRILFTDMWAFIKKGLTNSLSVCVEWLGVELLTFESIFIGYSELAATVILQNIVATTFIFSWGISMSVTNFVEDSIYDRSISNAKKYAIRAIYIFLLLFLPYASIISLFREYISNLFTLNTNLAKIINDLLQLNIPLVAIFDGLQGIFGGIIRGIGKNELVSYGNLACYFLLTQPFAITMAFFVELGVDGLWMAMGIGLFCNTVFFAGIIISQDWKRVVIERIDFVNESGNQELLAKSANIGGINNNSSVDVKKLLENSLHNTFTNN